MSAIKNRIQLEFAATEEWKQAEKNLADAQKQYDAAAAPIIAEVQGRAEYKKDVAEKIELDRKLRIMKQDANADGEAVNAAIVRTGELERSLKKMQTTALAANKDVTEAEARLNDAKSEMDAFKAKLEQLVAEDPEWKQAKADLAAAQQSVADARKSAALEAKSRRESEAVRRKSLEASRRRGTKPKRGQTLSSY